MEGRNVDLVIPLQNFRQTTVHHFGIQPFKRQEENAECGGVRDFNVFIVVSLASCRTTVSVGDGGGYRGGVAAGLGVLQVCIGIAGELGVNGQPHGSALAR